MTSLLYGARQTQKKTVASGLHFHGVYDLYFKANGTGKAWDLKAILAGMTPDFLSW